MAWISEYRRWLSESESLQNAQMVADHFAGTDWTRESLSAMIGNMRHESSINPDMYEYGYDWSADRGYGLVQWTPRSKYWDWAVARGLPPRNGDSMLARIDYEVDNNIQWIPRASIDNLTFAEFRSNSRGLSVDDLTEAFTWGYERPNQQAGEESMPARKAFARRALEELDWTGTGGGGVTPLPSVGSSDKKTQYQYEKKGALNGMTYIEVKKGDSLSAIAKKHGVAMDGIKRVSFQSIANKNELSAGEVLVLPKKGTVTKARTVTYKVKKGDTLSAIAKKHGTTVNALANKNKLRDPNLIRVGQVIKI